MMTGQGSDETPFSPTRRAHNRTVLLKNVFSSEDGDNAAPLLAPRRKASLVDNRVAEFELHFAKKREEMQAKLMTSSQSSCDDSVSVSQREEERRSRSALRKRAEEESLMREVHKSLGLAQTTEGSSWDAYAHDSDSPPQGVEGTMQKDGLPIPPPPMVSPAAQPTGSPSNSSRSSHRSSARSSTRSSPTKSANRYDSSGPFESNKETLHKPEPFQDSFAATHQKALEKIRKQRLEAEEKRKAAILEEARLLKLQAELLEQQALGAITEEEMKTRLYDKTDDDIDAQFGEMQLRSSSKSPGKHRDRSSSRGSKSRGRSRSKSKDKYSTSSRNRSKSRDGLRSSRHKDGLRTSRHNAHEKHGKDKSPSKHREKSPSKHRDKSPSKSGREKSPSKHRDKSPSSKSVSGRDKSPSKYGSARDRSKRERERSRSAGRLRDSNRSLLDGDGTVASSSKREKERSRSTGRLRDSSRSIGTSSRSVGTDFGESPPSSSRSIVSSATSGSVDSCGVERVRKPRSRSSGALKRERVKSKSMRVTSTTAADDDDDVLYTPTQFSSSRSRSLVIPPSSSHSIKSSLSFPHSPVAEGNEGEESLNDDTKKSSRSRSKDDKKERLIRSRSKDPKKVKSRSKSMSMVSTPDADEALGPVSVHTTHSSAVNRTGNMSFVQLEVQDEEVETAGTKVLEAINTPSKRKGNKYLSPLVKQFQSPKVGRKKEKKKDKKKAGPFDGLNADDYS